MMRRQSRRRTSRIRLPLWGLGLLILLFALLLVAGSVWIFTTVQRVTAQWEMTQPQFIGVDEPRPPAVVAGSEEVEPDGEEAPQEPLLINTPEPWQGSERVTLLFLGIDQRCDDDGPTRTDSMMVASIDPVGKTAAILSLPRDLWVEIPGFGQDRINQAHYMGEIYNYPGGGGPALAQETVAATLGIPVDYYVTVNFDVFVEVVDLIGGIDIEVPERIDDPTYPDSCYGYDPFRIAAGKHHLDGAETLKYARTRATFGGDVDRATRQQQVVLAIRDRVLRLGMLPQLIARAPALWQSFQDNVHTNLSVEEAIQLALLTQEIPDENVRAAVIDFDHVYPQTTPNGQQVLVPIRENIRELRDELFASPAIPTPAVEDLPQRMRREGARVALHNGTSAFGLAGETRDYLLTFGVNITEIDNADSSTYQTTQIIDYGTHPDTTLYLARLLSVPPLNVISGSAPDVDYDVLIILGSDWQVPRSQ